MPCAAHGLATARDGRCIVCRREERERQARRRLMLGAGGVAAVTVFCAVAAAARLFRREEAVTAAPAALAAETVPSIDRSPNTVSIVDSVRPAQVVAGIAPVPTFAPEVVTPAPSSGLAQAKPSASATGSPVPPSSAQVQAALQSVPIVMFSTSWCPTCARARSFLQANGIRYTERDIDHDQAALEELKRRSGNTLIPTLDIDGKMLRSGFDSSAIASTLAAAVERRLGVTGIRVRSAER